MNDSNIIYQARLHWILFFWPGALLCAAMLVDFKYESLRQIGAIVALLALLWLGITWVTYHFSSFVIKKKQVILRTGFWVRKTVDIPLNKIESIDIRQTLLGNLLRYGTLVITGTGGTRQLIHYLNRPLTCRRYIDQLMHV